MKALLDQWAGLRATACAAAGWSPDEAAAFGGLWRSRIADVLTRFNVQTDPGEPICDDTLQLELHWVHGQLQGAIFLYTKADSFFGTPVVTGFVDIDTQSTGALEWVADALARSPLIGDPNLDLHLERGYFETLLPLFEQHGAGLSAVMFHGAVSEALARLHAHESLAQPGDVRRAAFTTDTIDEVMALRQAAFAGDLSHCWFALNPKFAARQRAYLASLNPSDAALWLDPDQTLVAFSVAERLCHEILGEASSMELFIHPDARGQGLVRAIYEHHLGALQAHSVPHFLGVSSQPAVLHYGRVMGRWASHGIVRHKPRFPLSHFGLSPPVSR